MKLFKAPQTGGVPFYEKDLEFMQNATQEILGELFKCLAGTEENIQFSEVFYKRNNDPTYSGSHGGYIYANGKIYYCEATDTELYNPHVVFSDEVIADGDRYTIADGSQTIHPWVIQKAKLETTAPGTPLPEGAMWTSNFCDFKSLFLSDVQNQLTALTYSKIHEFTKPNTSIQSLWSSDGLVYVKYNTESNVTFENTLQLPTPSHDRQRIIVKYSGLLKGNIRQKVKSNDEVIYSAIIDNTANLDYARSVVFESFGSNWVLVSSSDLKDA